MTQYSFDVFTSKRFGQVLLKRRGTPHWDAVVRGTAAVALLAIYPAARWPDVAGLVGFKSIQHFTRVFHEITDATPGAWRRKYQAGICKDVVIDPHFSNTNRTIAGQTAPYGRGSASLSEPRP